MGQKYLFKNISVVNDNTTKICDLYVHNERIERIDPSFAVKGKVIEIEGEGKYLLPGVIDDQVHFREPGLTDKATIYTESKAALAGGVTSFMEMPNTIPNATKQSILEEKYDIASRTSLANYSFFFGVTNDNYDEVIRMNSRKSEVCGIKIFMGSSTGNMLVDDHNTLNRIFKDSELLIATHCEDEATIRQNYADIKANKINLQPSDHPIIRNTDACYKSSSLAIDLAKKYNTRLHILHISTAKELELFTNTIPLEQKRITSEVCVHHLSFSEADYDKLGYLIKCNPAIKSEDDQKALWEGLLENKLDVIATDHAPHLLSEKEPPYEKAHSGLPLVQHALSIMLDHVENGKITLEQVVNKMSHSVAKCFNIQDRGYLFEGYFADLVMIDKNLSTSVNKENILYKCGWSPFTGRTFPGSVTKTFVNGNCVYQNQNGSLVWDESIKGKRLNFKA